MRIVAAALNGLHRLRHLTSGNVSVIGVALRLLEMKLRSPERELLIQEALREAEGAHGEALSGVTERVTDSD